SPSVVRRLMLELASQPDPGLPGPEQLDELTAREREVMALVATGLSNDQIAQQLVVSPATAKTHVSRALMKLRARDRAQLVVLAYETGLVAPKHPPHHRHLRRSLDAQRARDDLDHDRSFETQVREGALRVRRKLGVLARRVRRSSTRLRVLERVSDGGAGARVCEL